MPLYACASSTEIKVSNNELIVLSHGLARGDTSMWRLEGRLNDAGYDVCSIDYSTVGVSTEQVLAESFKEIQSCLVAGKKTHFVGHSLGGLVIKHYLASEQKTLPNNLLGEVVFVGTPNKGSEVADHFKGHKIAEWFGSISTALMTGSQTLGNQITGFDIPVGVIAGTKSSVITESLFKGPNDGLVSVESAKLANMKDFITMKVGHAGMRYDENVAHQILYFLRFGKFNKTT